MMETNSWAYYMFDRMEEETKSKFVKEYSKQLRLVLKSGLLCG